MSFAAPAIFNIFAHGYNASRQRLVPDFNRFYDTVAQAMGLGFGNDEQLRVLDLGAGTGLLSAIIGQHFQRAEFVLADGAPQMLEHARERFAGDARFSCVELDFGRDDLPSGFNCVVSSLAIHHLEPDQLAPLFGRIRQSLKAGGMFVNADQTRGTSDRVEAAFEQQWQRDAREAGASEQELRGAIERMRADRSAPLEWQLNALRTAGFTEVECFYRRFRFAVYAGWRR